jgi:diacylglycerol kinase (ATP)
MKFAYILNPAAGGGRAGRRRDGLDDLLRRSGAPYSLIQTEAPGHATELAREATASHEAVIAVGGDGTIQEVVRGLRGTERPLGVLPLGTGNDFAKMIGMPLRPEEGVPALLSAAVSHVDLGMVRWKNEDGEQRERIFANAVGIGFDAMTAVQVVRFKKLGGRLAYLAGVMATLRLWRQPEVEVSLTGQGGERVIHHGPFFLASASNGISVGGGFYLTPDALVDDGLLDLCLIDRLSIPRVFQLLPRAMRGKHVGAKEVTIERTTNLKIRSGIPLPIHADGEVVTSSAIEIEVEVLPAVQPVLAPHLREAT